MFIPNGKADNLEKWEEKSLLFPRLLLQTQTAGEKERVQKFLLLGKVQFAPWQRRAQ